MTTSIDRCQWSVYALGLHLIGGIGRVPGIDVLVLARLQPAQRRVLVPALRRRYDVRVDLTGASCGSGRSCCTDLWHTK